MARKRNRKHSFEHPGELTTRRMDFRASGASGVHIDQKARRNDAGGRTNRVGSRSAARRAAIAFHTE